MRKRLKINNTKLQKKTTLKERLKKVGIKRIIVTLILYGLIIGASAVLIFALFIIIECPEFDKDKLYTKESTVVLDKNGIELARIGSENRELITYEDIPQVFIDALIATEDSRFFQHNGLDIARFAKATAEQLVGRNAGGASTITMQLIKNVYTKGQKKENKLQSFIRKFEDIYMAVFKVENTYTKEEILEFYVNTLWLGHDGNVNYNGIFGIEQGSQFYFGKSIRDISLPEASLLVGMYQNPTLYNPYRNPEGCHNRQNKVLTYMVNHGYITNEEKNAVLEIPIESLLVDNRNGGSLNSYQAIVDYVLQEVEVKTGLSPYKHSMVIHSTFDAKIQDVLTRMENGEFYKWKDDIDQEGVAVTSVEDGSIVALSGGRNYQAKGTNFATDINRQPGSSAKPFVDYGPYFEYLKGSPGDYLFDDPYKYSSGQEIKNADGAYQGMITIRQALVGSRNVPALQVFQKVAKEVGTDKIAEYIHNFGINFGPNLYESASIGGFNGTNPLTLSAAYAAYGRGGYYIKPYSFTKVDYDDGTSFDYKYEKVQVVSPQTAYLINNILQGVITSSQLGSINIKGTQVAAKTGTTDVDDNMLKKLGIPSSTINDAWGTSYSSEYSISLWYGYEYLSKEHYLTINEGVRARKAIMQALAKNIYSTNKTFKVPSGLTYIDVEKGSVPLRRPSASTPSDMIVKEVFFSGMEPTEISKRYAKLDTPTDGSYSTHGGNVTLSWKAVNLPDMMSELTLQKYFNDYYGDFAARYYERRLTENANNIGSLGYDIYLKNEEDGNLIYLNRANSNSYTQPIDTTKTYSFVIKASYSIYKGLDSNGLTITVKPSGFTLPEIRKPFADYSDTN